MFDETETAWKQKKEKKLNKLKKKKICTTTWHLKKKKLSFSPVKQSKCFVLLAEFTVHLFLGRKRLSLCCLQWKLTLWIYWWESHTGYLYYGFIFRIYFRLNLLILINARQWCATLGFSRSAEMFFCGTMVACASVMPISHSVTLFT